MKIFNKFKVILLLLLAALIVITPQTIYARSGALGGEITDDDFDALNPLIIAKSSSINVQEDLSTPGGVVSRLLSFSFPLAGFILFIMLFWGGFEIIYGASTSKAMEAGKGRITSALIGFFLLFASYWIIQILEEVLGIIIFL